MKRFSFFITALMLIPFLSFAQAKKPAPAVAAKEPSLYQRLGGKRAIAAVVDAFVDIAAKDPKVNFTRNGKFKNMDVPFLKGQLTDFISSVTGGAEKYVGKDMKTAHAGMKIKASEFDALATDLALALDKFKVPAKEKNELLTIAASTKSAIVEVDDSKSLYDRLGGKRAIAAVVDTFVNIAAKDPKVNFTRDGKFKSMDVPYLKNQLTDFISQVTGGPVKYVGKDMKTAHAGMKIKSSEFDALAADLAQALDQFKVPEAEKEELLTIAASTKSAIVEVKDNAKAATPAPGPKSLYERLGGAKAIKAVVDDFVPAAAADPRVNFFRDGRFKGINVDHLKSQLVNFITLATGGPNNYKGRDMKSAHAGMSIKASEFDAIADVLSKSLTKLGVPAKEKSELMTIAASTKKDIVQSP